MGNIWKLKPEIKVTVNDAEEEIQKDCFDIDVYLIENGISRLHFTANNNEGRTYLRRLRGFDTSKAYLRYSDEEYVQRFGGKIEKVSPIMSPTAGYTLQAVAYDDGRAIRNTYCAVDYGSESDNSAFDTPSEIIDDLRANRVNKNFDGADTGYNILGGNILTMAAPTIQYIKGGYRKNIDILNEVLLMYQAYQDGSAGLHWMVSPTGYLHIDQIGNHTKNPTAWPTYWRHSQTLGQLTQKRDITAATFTNEYSGYANKVLLITDIRKPAYDHWAEDHTSGGASLWGNSGYTSITNSTTQFVVGSHSLLFTQNGGVAGYGYLPSTEDAGWNITQIGSSKSIPRLRFYFYINDYIYVATTWVILFTTDHSNDYFYSPFATNADRNKWVHCDIPIGEYWESAEYNRYFEWQTSGNPDWTDINGVCFFTYNPSPVSNGLLYVDDLHLTGKIIREAYNSTHINLYNEIQKIVHMDTAVNDSIKTADDTGTAARLAYAELLASQSQPTRGTITTPIITDILPGQLVAVKHDWRYGTKYGIDEDYRIQQVHHHFGAKPQTTLTVTNDLTNSFAAGPSEALSALARALFYDPEAKSLKTTGIDTLVQRLSIDYA